MLRGFYKHKNSMDMVIEILQIPYKCSEYYKIKYVCWNLGQGDGPYRILPNKMKAKIYRKDVKNWRRHEPL